MLADVAGYYTNEGLQELAEMAEEIMAAAETLTAVQPQISSGSSDGVSNIGGEPTIVASVDVTPNTSGKVIVNSSALASSLTVGAEMRCAISADVSIPSGGLQGWEAAGVSPYIGQLAGTRVFNVTSTNPRTYYLVCQHSGPGDANIANAHISAIYVPGAFVAAA